ncbi:hypothetical protein SLS60_010748 [Paraconiothyrium brasiliense]|uniref:Major facilitator superfamily (MFS) profile domain-containing protein n=1 Tax=Paraconiothyrium brasiliense TaxID=300254 RepID=A0ABR3QLW1_9PLEO
MLHMSCTAFNFGFDVGTFGGVQGMQSFQDDFGVYNPKTKLWALPSWLRSVMTSTPFVGKALGAIGCGLIAERWGRRSAIFWLCILSFIGAALQTSATTSAQFTLGRIIAYAMTGMAVVVVPIYQGETAPAELRGMFGCTIQFMITLGQVVSSLVTFGTKGMTSNAGWQIPIGMQLVMPAVILILLPLVPESPRWLLSKDRVEDAVKNLKKLRKHAGEEEVKFEIDSLQYANANQHKGGWMELFNQKNRVRTGIAIFVMFGQQITGQAFPSQYGVIFYQSQGFASQAFLFNVLSNIISLVAVTMTWSTVDALGRRPSLLTGGSLMAAMMFILGGMGSVPSHKLTSAGKHMMVASIMLFSFFFSLSWAPVSYVVVSETAASRVKEKTNLIAMVISVLTTFVTSFSTPSIISAIGAKLGFVYGVINIMVVVATWFVVPELKGKSLEEVDQLLESGVRIRRLGEVETKRAEAIYEEKERPFERVEVVEKVKVENGS